MKKLNCIGDYCPIPILKMEMMLEKLQEQDSFVLLTDHSCVIEAAHEFLRARKIRYHIREDDTGIWEIYITKKPPW